MENEKTETKRLAEIDTAIEIMAAMRATRITRLALEEMKQEQERDQQLITRLNKEIDILNEERHLMYLGDENIQNKILNEYSVEMTEYFLGKKDNVR